MTAETATQKAQKAQTIASDPVFPPFGNTDWIKSVTEASTKLYVGCWGKAIDLAADRLQDQAAYLKSLSQCTDPAEALKLNAAFAQQSASCLLEDGPKLFDSFRSSVATIGLAK